MQRNLLLAAMLLTLAIPATSQADLVAGWDTWSGLDTTTGGAGTIASNPTLNAAGVTASALFPGQSALDNVWTASTIAANDTGTFGTLAGASTSIASAEDGAFANPTSDTGNTLVDFTISYTGAGSLDLDTFHFDGAMGGNQATRTWTLSSISGAVTASTISGPTVFPNFNGLVEADESLASLADRTLASGESATFRLTLVGNGNGGNGMRLDNVGFSGTITAVPEPTSLILVAFGSLGMLLRRRK